MKDKHQDSVSRVSMWPRFPAFLALISVSFCPFVYGQESLSEYLVALDDELRVPQSSQQDPSPASGKPASLDSRRLLQQASFIFHAAAPAQRQRLSEAILAFMPRYIVPLHVKTIATPEPYLAFTELHVIYSEILDRLVYMQFANQAAGDEELIESALQALCSAPSNIDFYRRVLDDEIAAGRYLASGVAQARALSTRLLQRTAWYSSKENLANCRDISRTKVAP